MLGECLGDWVPCVCVSLSLSLLSLDTEGLSLTHKREKELCYVMLCHDFGTICHAMICYAMITTLTISIQRYLC